MTIQAISLFAILLIILGLYWIYYINIEDKVETYICQVRSENKLSILTLVNLRSISHIPVDSIPGRIAMRKIIAMYLDRAIGAIQESSKVVSEKDTFSMKTLSKLTLGFCCFKVVGMYDVICESTLDQKKDVKLQRAFLVCMRERYEEIKEAIQLLEASALSIADILDPSHPHERMKYELAQARKANAELRKGIDTDFYYAVFKTLLKKAH